ncbi:hypothetical protein GCM10010211_10230 [Streptomyces albospinus]|uniref:Transposase n=1 Tax=Streptomyces albospinus TaxID=285515 RepID=A0ABQ2UQD0_9ACTN|nr:hypothetical protein GCM10010211_10230 [Streptomyces albospinus]
MIAERIGWGRGMPILKDRIRELRPACAPVDPVSRTTYRPGKLAQCDLWFPDVDIPPGCGRTGRPPVLVMVSGYSRLITARMHWSGTAGRRMRRIPRSVGPGRRRLCGGTGAVVTWPQAQMVLLSAQGMPVAKIAEVTFTSADRVRDRGLTPCARIHHLRVRSCQRRNDRPRPPAGAAGGRFGPRTVYEGDSQANVTIIEGPEERRAPR